MREIQPEQLAAWLQASASSRDDASEPPPLVLDVREDWEAGICRLPGSLHIPMGQIPARLEEIDPERTVVCYCHHGMRSMQVALFLERNGARNVYNLAGGIDAWARRVDSSCATY
jgi:rhodanese-related sulfurtransferase